MDTSLRAYCERLEEALREKKSIGFYNKDIFHASAIVYLAFRYAERHILILSNRLDLTLYGVEGILKSIRTFLEKPKVKLEVLVEQEIAPEHPLASINREFPEKIEIGVLPKEVVEKYKYNFMVVDDIGYRFERDREDYAATASFHEKDDESQEFIRRLMEIFRILKKRSSSVKSSWTIEG